MRAKKSQKYVQTEELRAIEILNARADLAHRLEGLLPREQIVKDVLKCGDEVWGILKESAQEG